MPKAWYQRLWIVLIAVLGSIYLLVPTFFWHPDESAHAAVATPAASPAGPSLVAPSGTGGTMTAAVPPAGGDDDEMPSWMRFFPKRRLRLGLDLVGGSNLGLSVDTDEALRALANGHRRQIRNTLEEEGIAFEDVNQPLGTAELEIELRDPADREALRTIMAEKIDQRMEEIRFSEEDGKGVATYAFTSAWQQSIEDDAVTQVLQLLRSRMNTFGVAEPNIFRERGNRIVVELPGLKDPAQAIENIKRTARLEFHIVDEEWYQQTPNGPAVLQRMVDEALATLGPNADDAAINLALQGRIPEDSAVFFKRRMDTRTNQRIRVEPLLLKREVALTGDRLIDAFPSQDRFGKWEVSLRFDQEGGEIFADITGENRGKRMAVVLENSIETDPQIQDRIEGGQAVITLGSQNRDRASQAREASNIARVLKTGALPAPVRIEQNRTVGPTLGQDAINKSLNASAVSALLVFAFAVYWYRKSGAIAIVCLIANAIVLLGVMTMFDATLTLPGIAGIVLTIAMALDANVLVYERIREELRAGKPIRTAVDAGYDKAFSSILDGNLTTAAAGIVLYWQGTDQIKGFAVTLLVGIATTLFTALVISRLLFDLWVLKYKPEELSI